jgi:REP element-mobilizing transposase RayT
MIVAYHAIFTTYGTWLPNDPRGSYSKKIYNEQLQLLGNIKYGRQNPQPAHKELLKFWTAAVPRLSRPPILFNENYRLIVAYAFGKVVKRLDLKIPACAIMSNHVHILILRTKYKIEYLVNQLKGAATRDLKMKKTPWTRGCWKVFINDNEAVSAAIKYIRYNPTSAGLALQKWDFISPIHV